jgi:hypothetical protein
VALSLTMRVAEARRALEAHAAANGVDLLSLSSTTLVDLMVGWYLVERADDVIPDASGDTLLFQWGTYDWGDGPSLQYDLTRQLIVEPGAGDEDIWQLAVTLHYAPSDAADAIGAGNRWCEGLEEVDGLRRFIEASKATAFVRSVTPLRVEVRFEPV